MHRLALEQLTASVEPLPAALQQRLGGVRRGFDPLRRHPGEHVQERQGGLIGTAGDAGDLLAGVQLQAAIDGRSQSDSPAYW